MDPRFAQHIALEQFFPHGKGSQRPPSDKDLYVPTQGKENTTWAPLLSEPWPIQHHTGQYDQWLISLRLGVTVPDELHHASSGQPLNAFIILNRELPTTTRIYHFLQRNDSFQPPIFGVGGDGTTTDIFSSTTFYSHVTKHFPVKW